MRKNNLIRTAIAVVGIILCSWGIWNAGSSGLSRLYSKYALLTRMITPADQAVRIRDSDPLAHSSLALVLRNKRDFVGAIREFERALALRPRDYVLWYELALSRDSVGDSTGAIAASEESVRLAPFYGRTHWLLGNLLFRAGRLDDAFRELRQASTSDEENLPNLIDLAWSTYKSDSQAVETTVNPQTNLARIALAKFFLKQGKVDEALALYHSAGGISDKDRQSLLTDLLAAKKFNAAYEVWSSGNPPTTNGRDGKQDSAIIDGGFEGRVSLKGNAFGWQVTGDITTIKFSLDQDRPHSGAQSLRLDWGGNAPPAAAIVSQLVLVEGRAKYLLRFAARTEDIVSAGLPQISIRDASNDANRVLAQSEPFPPSSAGWREYTLEFTTGDSTEAFLIRLERQGCPGPVCPVFGRLWLDDFSLQKQSQP